MEKYIKIKKNLYEVEKLTLEDLKILMPFHKDSELRKILGIKEKPIKSTIKEVDKPKLPDNKDNKKSKLADK